MKASTFQHQANLNLWAERIAAQKASGLQVDDWCIQNNLSRHKFYYWKRLIKESLLEASVPDIVPLPPTTTLAEDTTCLTSTTSSTSTTLTSSTALVPSDVLPLQTCTTNTSCITEAEKSHSFKLSTSELSLEIDGALSSDTIISILKVVYHA